MKTRNTSPVISNRSNFAKQIFTSSIWLSALCIGATAFAQTPVYQYSNSDPTWVKNGTTSFSVTPISEDEPNEIWERPVEDNKWTESGDTKTATGKYYAYADLKAGGWGYDGTYLYAMWDLVGGYFQEPDGDPDYGDGYKGHYYLYLELPTKKAILIEITDGTGLGTDFADDGIVKIWYEDTEGDVPEHPAGFSSSEVSGEARRNGTVIEVAVPISDINAHIANDFASQTAEWSIVGAAVSNPSSPSDLWAYYKFGAGIGSGVEYDTIDLPLVNPSIDIEKSTNGSDADTAPGLLILAGSPITWSYQVTNTGNTPLEDILVTDNPSPASGISCPGTTLAAGASMTCTATLASAITGQFGNQGTVVGSSPGNTDDVTDNDPSHYFGVNPSIDIEKDTNGAQSDTAPGLNIPVGNAVTWTYVVTNNGNVTLTSVGVTDSPVQTITCNWAGSSDGDTPAGTLSVGETVSCSAAGTATIGQYANTATATGTPPVGPAVNDTDDSHYFGVSPSIDIEKKTNGVQADTTPGPTIPVGNAVTWTYEVTNTGNTSLSGIAVSDDQLGPISCPGGQTTLAIGASMTCTAAVGTATAGQYSNIGSVVASSPGNSNDVSDSDPSHYFGSGPSIDIEKTTNGEQADSAPGPYIKVGDAVNWSYVVTNTGNVTLTSVGVTDSDLGAITCNWAGSSDGGTPAGTLSAGETVTCSDSGLAVIGQYANTGTATGTPPVGSPVNDTDDSHYFGASPDIDIVKTASPTTYAAVGTEITYTFAVTNTGNVTLTSVDVTDPLTGLSAITCDGGANPIASMAPAATVNCSATYSITQADINAGTVNNTATAEGECTATDDCPVSDTDNETITATADPDITIVKTASPKTFTQAGDVITYGFAVTNNGALTLTSVDVTDPLTDLSAITCDGGANPIASIAPGATVNCSASYTIKAGDVTAGKVDNTATAEGECADDACPVEDDDTETVNAILINLTKSVTSGPTYDKSTGRYTVVYRITATNGGTAGGIYDVVDDGFTNLAAGISLFGTPGVVYIPGDDSLDAGNNPPGWPNIALAENIGAGKTESWDITAQFSVNPGVLTADARSCVLDEAESGKGFYNSVLATAGETDTSDNDDCVNLPDPDLDLSKQVTKTESIGVNRYRVTYLVKVENSGDGPAIYGITDVPGFGAGITLDGTPAVTYVAIDDSFTSPVTAPAWTQIALNETIAGQSDESWQVVAEFDLDLSDAGYAANKECVSGDGGWVSGKGFFNSVTLGGHQEENLINNKDCSDPEDPLINLSKSAAPAVYNGDGTYDVTYTFRAHNQGPIISGYDLVDTLMPGAAMTPTAIQVPTAYVAGSENDRAGTIESPAIGDFTSGGAKLVSGETLAPGADEFWTITIRYSLDQNLFTPENADCVDDDGEDGNTGFNNYIEGSASETDFTDNDACVGVLPARLEIALVLIPVNPDLVSFSGATSASLTHGGVFGVDVSPGGWATLTSKAAIAALGRLVDSYTCDDPGSEVNFGDPDDLVVDWLVGPGQTVRCTLVLSLERELELIHVPVNNAWALLLLTLMLLATGWYFRPATIRKF